MPIELLPSTELGPVYTSVSVCVSDCVCACLQCSEMQCSVPSVPTNGK